MIRNSRSFILFLFSKNDQKKSIKNRISSRFTISVKFFSVVSFSLSLLFLLCTISIHTMDDDPNEFYNDASSMFFSKGKVITRDANGNVIVKDRHAAGRNISPGRGNQGVMVLCIVLGIVLFFLIGNYILYTYAQKTLPQDMKKKKKKPVSKKKMKRERLNRGLSTPGD